MIICKKTFKTFVCLWFTLMFLAKLFSLRDRHTKYLTLEAVDFLCSTQMESMHTMYMSTEGMKGSEHIPRDLTWSKSDYKFIIHLGDFADFLSSLSGLWTACNFIVNVRLMLDECFKQNLCCLRSIYLTHWNVFILCFMVYITNDSMYIPFLDRLTIYLLN